MLVDFAVFSFGFDRVHCALSRSFLVRNWCGAYATGINHQMAAFAPTDS